MRIRMQLAACRATQTRAVCAYVLTINGVLSLTLRAMRRVYGSFSQEKYLTNLFRRVSRKPACALDAPITPSTSAAALRPPRNLARVSTRMLVTRMHGLRAPVVVGDLLLDLLPHLRLLLKDLRNRLLANTLHLRLEQLEVVDALRDAGA